MEAFRPLLTLVFFGIAFWLRRKAAQTRKAAQHERQYRAIGAQPNRAGPAAGRAAVQNRQGNQPSAPRPAPAAAFQEAAPLVHSVKQPAWEETQFQTSLDFGLMGQTGSETPVPTSGRGDLKRSDRAQGRPASTAARQTHPFELPRFTANTLVQAVIAKEILTRPPSTRSRRVPGPPGR